MLEIKLAWKCACRLTPMRRAARAPFELRQKTRQRARLASGEEVALMLPRGTVLRGGDLLLASDGRIVGSDRAGPNPCCTSSANRRRRWREPPTTSATATCRWRSAKVICGSRPTTCSSRCWKASAPGVTAIEAPFEPESGAYATHSHGLLALQHRHHHDAGHGGRIHEYARIDDPDHT